MVKTLKLTITIIFFALMSLQAQDVPDKQGKYSALTQQYLADINSSDFNTTDSKYVYSRIEGRNYLNAFIKTNNQLDRNELDSLGVLVGTEAGDVWTVKIPPEQFENFVNIKEGIALVQLDQAIFTNLERALARTRVNLVHSGIDLPHAYTGKDVVVGILDVGFDYTHPTFYSRDGEKYRIKRIWEQKKSGTPPTNYSYGNEITDTIEMLAAETDIKTQSHGAHVAGIAAGSGRGSNTDAYKGVAYDSELVFVGITPPQEQWTSSGMTDIVDGLNYVYSYAESQGKPAIANLSWGCSIGQHDGSSLFNQAVDNLTGPGKIFTISAGNNGDNNIHLHKEFTESDSLLQTFVSFDSRLLEKKTWVDIWGEQGESFCIDISSYSGLNPVSSTEFICLEDISLDTFLIGSDLDTLFIKLTKLSADINGKPHALLDLYSKTNNSIAIKLKSGSGNVHLWTGYVLESTGYYGAFESRNLTGFSEGDTDYTIGQMACTKSAITVGAYASKIEFINLSGGNTNYGSYVRKNAICPFSSKGPTTDGRYKPDIAAPGMTLASAVNSFDDNYKPGGNIYGNVVHKYTESGSSHDYYYGEASGTSMSSPMAAGIIALALEAKPDLSPSEIKELMANTALLDGFTTPDPDPNIWGVGKIDAHAMLKSFFVSAISENEERQLLSLYPMPVSDELNIPLEGHKMIHVFNSSGILCHKIRTASNRISLGELKPGIYIISIYNQENEFVLSKKLIKL